MARYNSLLDSIRKSLSELQKVRVYLSSWEGEREREEGEREGRGRKREERVRELES
jgi:hypothetical protein